MNANTYVDRPNDKGTALDRERQLATLLEDDDVLCAHVYDDSGYSEFLFHGSPENIANFIGARPMVHQIVLTDRQERPVLWTIGYFIDRCPDKVLLEIDREFIIDPNKKIVYDRDMALLTGYDILLFQPYPIGEAMLYPLELDVAQKAFYTDVTAFLRFYKFMLFQIVEQGASDIGIRCFSDRIAFQIIF